MHRAAAAALLLAASCSRPAPDAVRVFAASSLREAAEDVAGEWTRRTGRPVLLRFDSTPLLARQIGEGAEADLFLAADPRWLEDLAALERRSWLSNRLVLVVPRGAPDPDPVGLAGLAVAASQVPAGRYAREAWSRSGWPWPPRIVEGSSVRDVARAVLEGGAPAGVVYATDARVDPGLRVVHVFPEASHPPIVIAAGLLTPAGRDLYETLFDPWALDLARGRGFAEPPK